jgi:hypothetical protein
MVADDRQVVFFAMRSSFVSCCCPVDCLGFAGAGPGLLRVVGR